MKIKCQYCGKEYPPAGIGTHIWRSHTEEGREHDPFQNRQYEKGKPAWNAGLTKETDPRVKKYSESASKTFQSKISNGTFIPNKPGKEATKKLSELMKSRHQLGLAHNIGQSRWNNEPSWPEKFFMEVIQNEFQDKDYLYEQPFFKYSLDFVWQHKKKVIEIDGEQHYRFEEQMRRDQEKDKLLLDNGYQILRIRWKEMCHATKFWIWLAKKFIE